ncbi:hypothetical protein FGO68_gene11968 [Halteria grandinella]|uniref:Uncharacterized protein n=1 Tax=Halteria grandinella TaxID=5974 RepID=A0A8J8NYZ3_HALGN|nr:hypothetical protein FGO68_gene11968 [Halteria grandinella]
MRFALKSGESIARYLGSMRLKSFSIRAMSRMASREQLKKAEITCLKWACSSGSSRGESVWSGYYYSIQLKYYYNQQSRSLLEALKVNYRKECQHQLDSLAYQQYDSHNDLKRKCICLQHHVVYVANEAWYHEYCEYDDNRAGLRLVPLTAAVNAEILQCRQQYHAYLLKFKVAIWVDQLVLLEVQEHKRNHCPQELEVAFKLQEDLERHVGDRGCFSDDLGFLLGRRRIVVLLGCCVHYIQI